MIIVCAWCKKELKLSAAWDVVTESYGVCKGCAALLKRRYKIIGPLYWDDIERLKNSVADGNPT